MSVNDLAAKEDRPAYVRFEIRAVKDPEASLKAGHYVSKDQEWVAVSILGSTDIYRQKAEKWFAKVEKNVENGRTPLRHLELYRQVYENWKKGIEAPLDGTSVKDWNALSPAQCENLIKSGMRTIEDVANPTPEAVKRYGMGFQELKHKANAWLQAATDQGIVAEELAASKRKIEQLEGTIESLQNKIKLMETQEEERNRVYNKDGKVLTGGAAEPYTPVPEEKVKESEEDAQKKLRMMLFQEYEAKYGHKPHHRMKNETIRESLRD